MEATDEQQSRMRCSTKLLSNIVATNSGAGLPVPGILKNGPANIQPFRCPN